MIIPTFDKVVKDKAGYKEFAGELEYADASDNTKKTQYIPTLFYKDKETGLELDTAKTISYNISKWGKFYGYKPNFKLLLIPRKVEW